MRRLLSLVTTKLSLFWRYFFLLSAVALLFLAAFSVTSRQFADALQTSYLEQAQANFDQNCSAFSRSLFLTYSLPPALEGTEHYFTISSAEAPLSPRNTYLMANLRNIFLTQCSLLDLPGECFVYFPSSNSCITRRRLFPNSDDCFSSFLQFQAEPGSPSIQELVRSCDRTHTLRLFPLQQVSVGGEPYAPHLLVLTSSTYGNAVYGFLYSADSLLKHFHLNALPEDTILSLLGPDGSVVFSHGGTQDAQREYTQLSCDLPSLSCTAVISIPRSYFLAATRSVRNTVLFVLAFTVAAGLLLCLFLSHLSVRPFRRLIAGHSMTQVVEDADNELVTIDRFLRRTREKTAALQSMLLSSLLVRAFSGQPIREDEYQNLSSTFPLFQEPLRAAVIYDRTHDHPAENHPSMITLLQDALPSGFLCEYINLHQALILFPCDPSAYDRLLHTLQELNRSAPSAPRFVGGVSAPFVGVSELTVSIQQALFCVPEDPARPLISFSEELLFDRPSRKQADFDLQLFQQALASWNQTEMHTMVERCVVRAEQGRIAHPEEVFYCILFLLRDAAQAGDLSLPACERTAYLHTATPASNLRQLTPLIDDLFCRRSAVQLSARQQQQEDMVRYVGERFPDHTFSLFALARHFNVSERYAHNAIQSLTGMNFSSFLSLTRMREAARLLRETDESVQTIAVRCGYPAISTFYRNFKKHYQLTPAEYKDSLPRPAAERSPV